MIGARIGGYRIVRRMGQGGMGLIFEAVHERIGRRAAIKVLRPHLSQDPQTVMRLLNEARATNLVPHPGLVSIFDSGQLPGGDAYLIMEYLEGRSLRQRLDEEPPLLHVLSLFRLLASALCAAHRCGIVHRDLKPDNVMVVADPDVPGGERVKVLDFGVAKLAARVGEGDVAAYDTPTGTVLGTPSYMAPEQCRGLLVTAQVDVYALGVMLYEALCGVPPFQGDNAFDVMAMHVFDEPPAPRLLVPEVRADLEALVLEMLHKRPEDRPAMAQVAAALGEQTGDESGAFRGLPLRAPGAGASAAAARSRSDVGEMPTLARSARPAVAMAPPSFAASVSRPLAPALPPVSPPRRFALPAFLTVAASLCTAGVMTLMAPRGGVPLAREQSGPREVRPPDPVAAPEFAAVALGSYVPAVTEPAAPAARPPEAGSRRSVGRPVRARALGPSRTGDPALPRPAAALATDDEPDDEASRPQQQHAVRPPAHAPYPVSARAPALARPAAPSRREAAAPAPVDFGLVDPRRGPTRDDQKQNRSIQLERFLYY